MAVFNPDQGGVPSPGMPDQTGASRGQIADKSLGIALEGVAAGVKGAVDVTNEYNHWQIDKTVRSGFDEANKPYSDILPKDLSKASDTIGSLQAAYDQGKLSDVYYTGQLAKLSKQLRAQYPQYEDYVDQTIQQVTGIRPANAFRNSLMQEFQQQSQSVADEEKFQRQYIKENEQYISGMFPDYWQNPDKYDFKFIQQSVANAKAQKNTLETQNLQIDYLEKNHKLTTEQAGEAATQSLGYTVQTSMAGLSNTLGISGDDLFKKIQDMNGKGYSPQEFQQVMGQLGALQSNIKMNLLKQMQQKLDPSNPDSKSFAQILGPDEAKKQIDAAMAPIDQIVSYATDQNWGLATYYINLNKVGQDKTLNSVLKASPDLQIGYALSKIDQGLADSYLTESGRQTGIFAQMVPELAANIATGDDTFTSAADRIAKSPYDEAAKAGGLNALIDSNKQTIVSGKASPDQFKSAVEGTYGLDKNGKSVFSYIKPDEYNDLYRTMYSKDVTDSIVKSGDKSLMQTYLTSAIDTANATPDYFKAAKALNDVQKFSKYATVQFSPESNKLIMSIDQQKMLNEFGSGDTNLPVVGNVILGQRAQDFKAAQNAVNTLNNEFDTLTPVMDGLGMSKEQQTQVLQGIVKQFSVDLTQGKQPGFFDWLLQGMSNMTSEVDPNKGLAEQMAPIDTFDFATPNSGVPQSYLDKVSGAESRGNPNAKNPSSTATGTFQFLDSTYNTYARKLGLTGSKNDPGNQEAAMKAYTVDSSNALQANGLPVTDQNLYALHFLGQQDGPEVLSAPDTTLLSDLVSPKVISSNKFLSGMTVADFKNWLAKKMA